MSKLIDKELLTDNTVYVNHKYKHGNGQPLFLSFRKHMMSQRVLTPVDELVRQAKEIGNAIRNNKGTLSTAETHKRIREILGCK